MGGEEGAGEAPMNVARGKRRAGERSVADKYRRLLRTSRLDDSRLEETPRNVMFIARAICEHICEKKHY